MMFIKQSMEIYKISKIKNIFLNIWKKKKFLIFKISTFFLKKHRRYGALPNSTQQIQNYSSNLSKNVDSGEEPVQYTVWTDDNDDDKQEIKYTSWGESVPWTIDLKRQFVRLVSNLHLFTLRNKFFRLSCHIFVVYAV